MYVLTVQNYGDALHKHVILFQFDSTVYQYTILGTYTDMEMVKKNCVGQIVNLYGNHLLNTYKH